MYYLTYTANRKNAKRHIAMKSNDLATVISNAKRLSYSSYLTTHEIYDGRWNLIYSFPPIYSIREDFEIIFAQSETFEIYKEEIMLYYTSNRIGYSYDCIIEMAKEVSQFHVSM